MERVGVVVALAASALAVALALARPLRHVVPAEDVDRSPYGGFGVRATPIVSAVVAVLLGAHAARAADLFRGQIVISLGAASFLVGGAATLGAILVDRWVVRRVHLRSAYAPTRDHALRVSVRGGAVSSIAGAALAVLGLALLMLVPVRTTSGTMAARVSLVAAFAPGALTVAALARTLDDESAAAAADRVATLGACLVAATMIAAGVHERNADVLARGGVSAVVFALLPLTAASFAILAAVCGAMAVTTDEREEGTSGVRRGLLVAMALSVFASATVGWWMLRGARAQALSIAISSLVAVLGALATVALFVYCAGPARRLASTLARARLEDEATSAFATIGVSLEAAVVPAAVLATLLLVVHQVAESSGLRESGGLAIAVGASVAVGVSSYVAALEPLIHREGAAERPGGARDEVSAMITGSGLSAAFLAGAVIVYAVLERLPDERAPFGVLLLVVTLGGGIAALFLAARAVVWRAADAEEAVALGARAARGMQTTTLLLASLALAVASVPGSQ